MWRWLGTGILSFFLEKRRGTVLWRSPLPRAVHSSLAAHPCNLYALDSRPEIHRARQMAASLASASASLASVARRPAVSSRSAAPSLQSYTRKPLHPKPLYPKLAK